MQKMTFKNGMDTSNWVDVFSSCLGQMRAIQEACGQIITADWNLDLSRGILRFGAKEYNIQLIGNESTQDNTWKWGWDNVNHFDEQILLMAESVKERGMQLGLEPLCVPDLPLTEQWNGHNLSIVSCGIWEENIAYYRCPHENGAVFVAILDMDASVFQSIDSVRFSRITMECLQGYNMNHPIFVESFLQWNRTPYEWVNELELCAHFAQDMTIWFEQVDQVIRIRQMKGQLAK